MLRGRTYLMRAGTKTVAATIAPLKYKLNVDTLEHVAANQLEVNEIGVCAIELAEPIAFDPYSENRETGGFILIDRITFNDGRRRPAAFRAAPLAQHPLAGARHRQACPRGREAASSRASSG